MCCWAYQDVVLEESYCPPSRPVRIYQQQGRPVLVSIQISLFFCFNFFIFTESEVQHRIKSRDGPIGLPFPLPTEHDRKLTPQFFPLFHLHLTPLHSNSFTLVSTQSDSISISLCLPTFVMSMTYDDWRRSQNAAAAHQEAQQPFDNPVYEYTYINRQGGDPPPAQAEAPAYNFTYAPQIQTVPFYYQYPRYYSGAMTHLTVQQPQAYWPTPQYAYPPAQTVATMPMGVHYGVPHHYPQVAHVPPPVGVTTTASGQLPWYGRTRAEVEADNAAMAAIHAREMEEATVKFKPGAEPGDLFWVWEPDHKVRNLYSFATIDKEFKGKWHMDPANNIAYYVREKKK